MFKLSAVLAFVAAASAASWPMVTVNANGNLVLNSPTKAGSFQLNAVTATSAPTSSGTASRSTVTALAEDTDAFIVSVPSSPATSAGYKLPTATEGREIRFYNSGSGKGAFTIWTGSTSVFIDGTSATTIDIASTTSYVVATATSSTNWVIRQNNLASDGLINKKYRLAASVTLSSNAATLTAAQIAGGILTVTPTAATTVTTPTATAMTSFDVNSANGDSYEFSIYNAGTVSTANPTTDLTITLTAGTNFAVPSDTTGYIVPGQTRTYIAYRISSSSWKIIGKSQATILSTSIIPSATGATTNAATTVALGTAHGLMSSLATSIRADTALQVSVYTATNNYAKLGDTCDYLGSVVAGGTHTGDVTTGGCQITADNTLTVNVAALTASALTPLPVVRINKQ